MADNTGIEWCDATFNPWIGCTKVSPGCDNCYAARQDNFRHWTLAGWGAGQPRKRTKTWGDPVKWNAREFVQCSHCGWRGEPEHGEICDGQNGCGRLTLAPARRRVFCASLADVFDNEVDPEWRADLFELIRGTPNLDWLLLTKRIGNVGNMLPVPFDFERLYPNVWIGATIVNQEEADRDIPKLLATPARVRFLSMEPLLGSVDLGPFIRRDLERRCPRCSWAGIGPRGSGCPRCGLHAEDGPLHWVITGGESGPGARPMHPDWARYLREQCAAAGVPFLFKQWGEWAPPNDSEDHRKRIALGRAVGWLDATGFIGGGKDLLPVGKKAAGRLLDGVEHNGFPEVRCAT